MALVYFDGFDDLGTYSGIEAANKGFTVVTGPQSPALIAASITRYGYGQGLLVGSQGYYQVPITSTSHGITGFAAYYGNNNTGTMSQIVHFLNNSTTLVKFQWTSFSGRLIEVRNAANTVLGTTVIAQDLTTWDYLEFRVKISATVGEVEIRKNGSSILSLTGLNLGSTNIDTIRIGCYSGANSVSEFVYLDDIYIVDNSDATGFLGETRVVYLLPNADTAQKDFSTSAGSNNYALVSDGPVSDSDTTYVQTVTNNAKDLYELDPMPFTPNSIKGLRLSGNLKSILTPTSGKLILKTGGTTYEGTAFFPGSSYATFKYNTSYSLLTNPDTSAAWTTSDIDALQIGIKNEVVP